MGQKRELEPFLEPIFWNPVLGLSSEDLDLDADQETPSNVTSSSKCSFVNGPLDSSCLEHIFAHTHMPLCHHATSQTTKTAVSALCKRAKVRQPLLTGTFLWLLRSWTLACMVRPTKFPPSLPKPFVSWPARLSDYHRARVQQTCDWSLTSTQSSGVA